MLLVEFEPQSIWSDTFFTIAIQALKSRIKTDLHILQRRPEEVKAILTKQGLDVRKLQDEDLLRIIDSYTVQTGLGSAENPKGSEAFKTKSLRMSDWGIAAKSLIQGGIAEADKHRLHLDDNLTVLTRYNPEDAMIDYWRTRLIPLYRASESVLVNPLAIGVASDSFVKQCETLADGILDFKSYEKAGKMEHYVRVRTLHGRAVASQWQPLTISDNGYVTLDRARPRVSELGIAGWLKGAKKY